MKLLSNSFYFLKKGLDAAWLKNEVISNNIANADTPGFKASKIDFEGLLKDEMESISTLKRTDNKHLSISENESSPYIKTDYTTSMRADGNNVDMENEMVELAKVNLLYQAMIQKISKELSALKYAINEGKR